MKSIPNKIRSFFIHLATGLFSTPHLPDGLISAVVLLILFDAGLVLGNQNLVYWTNFPTAVNNLEFLRILLSIHPIAFIGACLGYLVVVWLLLQVLTRSLALALWNALAALHLWRIGSQTAQLLGLGNTVSNPALAALLAMLAGLVIGVLLSMLLLRPTKAPALSIDRPKRSWMLRWKVGAAALLFLLIASGAALSYFNSLRGGWQMVRLVDSPGSRCCGALAYDTQRGRAVLFGGASEWLGSSTDQLNDTWEWNGTDWEKMNPATKPVGRTDAAMAYDPALGVMVLFGGYNKNNELNDTWEYDGVDWKFMRMPQPPPARLGTQLFYDPVSKKLILSGGYGGTDSTGKDIYYSDAWEWDGQSWQAILSDTPSPSLTRYSAALDSAQQRIIAMNYNSPLIWATDHWAVLNAKNPPSGRIDARMVSIPGIGVLMFGGYHDPIRFDETWLLQGAAWKQLSSTLHPLARSQSMMFYEPSSGRIYLYGGDGGESPYLSDMWEYKLP